jgi:hypothetical protein
MVLKEAVWEVDRTGRGSCPMLSYNISGTISICTACIQINFNSIQVCTCIYMVLHLSTKQFRIQKATKYDKICVVRIIWW